MRQGSALIDDVAALDHTVRGPVVTRNLLAVCDGTGLPTSRRRHRGDARSVPYMCKSVWFGTRSARGNMGTDLEDTRLHRRGVDIWRQKWTCDVFVPAARVSNARGFFRARTECLRRGLQKPLTWSRRATSADRRGDHDLCRSICAPMFAKTGATAAVSWHATVPLIETSKPCGRRSVGTA